jgi:hypothetical protein
LLAVQVEIADGGGAPVGGVHRRQRGHRGPGRAVDHRVVADHLDIAVGVEVGQGADRVEEGVGRRGDPLGRAGAIQRHHLAVGHRADDLVLAVAVDVADGYAAVAAEASA